MPRGGAVDNEILRDKFRGMMLGLAVGDSLGAPFAGWERVDRKSFEGREHDPSRLSYTDDTHLSIGVAESLIDRAGFDGKRMGTMSARNYKEDPWRKYS